MHTDGRTPDRYIVARFAYEGLGIFVLYQVNEEEF